MDALEKWLDLYNRQADLKKTFKTAEADLDAKAFGKYPELSEDEVKTLVVCDKWMATLRDAVNSETGRVSQALTTRVKELAERYEVPMPEQSRRVGELEATVAGHLEKMGFSWH